MKLAITVLAAALLAACSAADTARPDATSPDSTTVAPTSVAASAPEAAPTPATSAAGDAASTQEDAASVHATSAEHPGMVGTAQAGWYSAGRFRACGAGAALKVDKAADIDRRIEAGGMSATDPVYVKLEGMAMGTDQYMVTRVVQVGSPTPVRDCAMSGTTTQGG
ncbi:hypothetical protein [Lysobacter xanthus]